MAIVFNNMKVDSVELNNNRVIATVVVAGYNLTVQIPKEKFKTLIEEAAAPLIREKIAQMTAALPSEPSITKHRRITPPEPPPSSMTFEPSQQEVEDPFDDTDPIDDV